MPETTSADARRVATGCEHGAGECGRVRNQHALLVIEVVATGVERLLCLAHAGDFMLAAVGADPTMIRVSRIPRRIDNRIDVVRS